MPLIEVKNVSKWHKGQRVLSDVSLTVPKGANLGLIGPGGAGKTLLLKIMAGLVDPDEGTVVIRDKDIHQLPPDELAVLRRDMGMLFQNYALFDSMTVAENIAFPLERTGDLSREAIDDRVQDLLHQIDLPGIGHKQPSQLSGGMKKRVSFARAIVQDPPIIFYDDPSAGLDPVTASKIFELLKELKDRSDTTSVTASHHLVGIETICDRVAMIYEGRLLGIGPVDEFNDHSHDLIRDFWQGGTSNPLESSRL